MSIPVARGFACGPRESRHVWRGTMQAQKPLQPERTSQTLACIERCQGCHANIAAKAARHRESRHSHDWRNAEDVVFVIALTAVNTGTPKSTRQVNVACSQRIAAKVKRLDTPGLLQKTFSTLPTQSKGLCVFLQTHLDLADCKW